MDKIEYFEVEGAVLRKRPGGRLEIWSPMGCVFSPNGS